MLDDLEGAVVPGLCKTLVRLGDRAAVPGLVDALDRAKVPSARHAVWIALGSLAGEGVAADAARWNAYAFD